MADGLGSFPIEELRGFSALQASATKREADYDGFSTLGAQRVVHAFGFLALMNPRITPPVSKVHLVTWQGREQPIDMYLAGKFDEWQRWQERRNFERSYVVSLINLPDTERWLFAGAYLSAGVELVGRGQYYYKLKEDSACSGMNGRLVIKLGGYLHQSCLNAENLADQMLVTEVLPERYSIADFPGFKGVDLSKAELDLIIQRSADSWRAALSSVAGIYLVSDTQSGRLYVDSVSGEGGLWQRWCECSTDGHGGHPELRKLLGGSHPERANAFRYSILEIADLRTSADDMRGREQHWRKVLLSADDNGETG